MNLRRIRVDPDGLLTQDQRGMMRRIALGRDDIDAIIADGAVRLKGILDTHGGSAPFFDAAGDLVARLDIIDEPYDGLNRPLRIYYGIEPRCDLACTICGPRDLHDSLRPATEEQERYLITQIADAGAFQLQLTGGEIGVRGFDLLRTMELTRELGLAVILSTNGVWRCIDRKDAFLEELASCGNIIQSKISIDGTEEMHESIRGKGTYAPTVDTLAKLAEYGLNPRISTTIIRSSCNLEQLEHLVGLAKRYRAGFQPIPLRPIGRGADMLDEIPTKKQLIDYTQHATRLRQETGVPLSFNFDIYEGGRQVPIFDLHNPVSCGAPLWGVQVTHLGEVYPCGFAQEVDKGTTFRAGVISDSTSLTDIWLNSDVLRNVRAAGKSAECNACTDYGKGCWGGCWVVGWIKTGRVDGMDPYCLRQP
ncbi:radical SAM protein [Candidatus Woesearchaeota archaeon]|nr:radical SAM protein [Candidatus Woesearchaeota archaeon]